MHQNEFDIRGSLKRFSNANTFSISHIAKSSATRVTTIAKHGFDTPANCVHNNWDGVDLERRSAACSYEQVRARLFCLGSILPALIDASAPIYLLTYADTNDRYPIGQLYRFQPNRLTRKLRSALTKLKRSYPDLKAFGTVEVSASTSTEGELYFEPHAHLVIAGCPKPPLDDEFRSRLSLRATGHPIQFKIVTSSSDLAAVLSYLLKFYGEVRSTYLDGETVKPGYPNLMNGAVLAEWLAWSAGTRIDELLIAVGLRHNFMADFRSRELQPIIAELLESSRRLTS